MPDPTDFERRLADAFRRYAGRVPTDIDATALAREIATASAHHTDRHLRWWPFGPTHTIMRRTQIMLSPARAITAGAIVFALGGVMLIAQPFQQQSNVPGAEAEAIAPTWVTGELQFAPSCTDPTSEIDGAVHHMRGADCDSQTWTTDDPRLTGEVRAIHNADVYEPGAEVFRGSPGTNVSVISRSYDVRNEAGGWSCRSYSLAHGFGWYPEPETGETVTCVGEGGNDGLSAILVLDGPAIGPWSISGLIVPGDLPPLPEPPPATE